MSSFGELYGTRMSLEGIEIVWRHRVGVTTSCS